jgi:hypothetical protein
VLGNLTVPPDKSQPYYIAVWHLVSTIDPGEAGPPRSLGIFKIKKLFFFSWLAARPLGLSLYPAVSGGHDIVLGDRFRTKLAYTLPLLTTSVELGCKKT